MSIRVRSLRGERGFGRLKATLKQVPQKALIAAAFGSYEAMQEVMKDARRRAPVDTGRMRASGYVSAPEVRGGSSRVDAGFGGPSEKYVLRVHNDPKHAKTGEPFFFQNALDAGEGLIREVVRKWVRSFLRSGRLLPHPQKEVPQSPWEQNVG